MGTVNGILALFCAICTLVMVFGLQYQKRIHHTKDAGIFHWMLFAAFFALLFGGIGWVFGPEHPAAFRVFVTFSLLVLDVMLTMYSDYVIALLKLNSLFSRRIKQINYAAGFLMVLLWLVNAIRPFFFDFQTLRFFHPAGTLLIFLGLAVIYCDTTVLICLNRKKIGRVQFIILLVLPVLPLISCLPNLWTAKLQLLYPTVFFALLTNFVRLFNLQFADLDAQREKLHVLQIRSTTERMKPHYIYNVLTSIYYLCGTNPDVAQQAIATFSDYLRSVLENLDAGGLIPFSHELRTIRNYLSLEHMRFGDRFHVSFHIEAEQFVLPPFSLQPIVENAVKHGVAKSDLVGDIHIESLETPEAYLVTVSDNCGGFDAEQFKNGKSSFGLRYIQQILSMTVNGKLIVESELGVGTKITIQLPKEEVGFLKNDKKI